MILSREKCKLLKRVCLITPDKCSSKNDGPFHSSVMKLRLLMQRTQNGFKINEMVLQLPERYLSLFSFFIIYSNKNTTHLKKKQYELPYFACFLLLSQYVSTYHKTMLSTFYPHLDQNIQDFYCPQWMMHKNPPKTTNLSVTKKIDLLS